MAWFGPGTHYSKRALLLFGGGLVLGLVVVVAGVPWVGYAASLAMALGVALLPAALVADWWRARPWTAPAAKRPRRKKAAARSASRRRGATRRAPRAKS